MTLLASLNVLNMWSELAFSLLSDLSDLSELREYDFVWAMGRRSLQASPEGIQIIKKALKRKKQSQTYIAGAVGCSRQTIWSLLQGNPTDYGVFMDVCSQLGLNWEEIVEPESSEPEQNESQNIDALVQDVRQQIQPYIQERCGTMRVLDMTQPIGLGQIYTSVNILEKITGRRGLQLTELMRHTSPEKFDRFCLGDVRERRVPGLEAVETYRKLMILGKPGAGKTTFLKHLAIQCIGETFQSDRVPVFITLKDFAEADGQPSLLEYMSRLAAINPVRAWHAMPLPTILGAGRALVLLDGLDEVRDSDSSRVLRQIREFSQQFPQNQFVITCRIAAREYTFEQFTEVEIADFDYRQIADFSSKWFRSKNDPIKAERFLERLKEDEPIRELATNPLLLTLLCLVFEDSGSFPTNRARLYEQGVEKLLRKWNPNERERDPIYKKLSPDYREELLSQIAWKTFKRGNYFFNQRDVGKQVREYIQSLPGIHPEDLLRLDCKAVLESIEAQHGLLVERARSIYSFSHLTFHEYFTAHKLVTSCNPDADDDPTLQGLTSHVTEKRWWEVFLLTVGMLDSADVLLQSMKARIDGLLAGDKKLQQFLKWLDESAQLTQLSNKLVTLRAFYLSTSLDIDCVCADSLRRTLEEAINDIDLVKSALDYTFEELSEFEGYSYVHGRADKFYDEVAACMREVDALHYTLDCALKYAYELAPSKRDDILINELESDFNFELAQPIEQLKNELSDCLYSSRFVDWWQTKGQAWTERLRAIIIEYRNIGYDWQFSEEQKARLKQYYDANKLLVNCLNSDCYVSREVRQEIEETLLLPIAEIQKRQQRG
ncbi:MAG TPA: NACHT domain-containing NTPase [Allocoleopsis sp.]